MEYQKLFFLTILTIFFIHVWWCKMQEWSPTQLQSKFHLITAKLNYFLIARFKLGISELQGGSTLSTDSLGKQSFTFFRYSMFSYIQILMLLQSKSDNSKISIKKVRKSMSVVARCQNLWHRWHQQRSRDWHPYNVSELLSLYVRVHL